MTGLRTSWATRIASAACVIVLAFLARDAFGSFDHPGCGDLCSEAFWARATEEDVTAGFSLAPAALSYRGHIIRLAVSSGGSAAAVETLLRAGAPPNARFEGEPWDVWDGYGNRTVLQEAARRDADVVSVLLSFGALPHLADRKRRTPLHDAVAAGLTRAAAFLLQAGADPRAVDTDGVRPTDLAERLDNDAMRFLLRTVTAPPPCGRLCAPDFWKTVTAEQLTDLLARTPYTRERSQRGDAPLHVALKYAADIELLELLLDHGMDPNARNARDDTPLHVAAWAPADTAAIRALLKRGAMLDLANGQGQTPLHVAADHAEIGAVRVLLDAGANPDVLGGAFFDDRGKLKLLDKELEQIVVYGYYRPKNPNRLDNFKEEVIRQGRLKPGETFEEKYKHLLDKRNENFYYSSMSYCYNRRPKKEPVFKDNLRIRLYAKDGRLLAEDFLRLERSEDDSFTVVAYLPYHDAGHEIHIVNIQGEKEARLEKLGVNSQSALKEISRLYDRGVGHRTGWTYRLTSQCYIAAPLR